MHQNDANNTNQDQRPPQSPVLLVATAVGCLMVGFLGARFASSPGKVIRGDLEVDYMYEESQSSAGGGKLEASKVEFFEQYVVVTHTGGSQHLWSTNRLRRFSVSHK